jgi:hypothetical protein
LRGMGEAPLLALVAVKGLKGAKAAMEVARRGQYRPNAGART